MVMNRIVRTALLAGATTAACWAADTLLALRRQRRERALKKETKAALQDWENEGGAVKSPSMPAGA